MQYASQLGEYDAAASLPPVDKWDPPFCGDIDLVIRRDGTWVHEGTPIGRARLVRLFSTVLKREGDEYFLVTPVEKLGIQVEAAPFVAVLCEQNIDGENFKSQTLRFTTNVGDVIEAGRDHAISWRQDPYTKDYAPYLHIRRELDAMISRNVYFELVNWGTVETIDDIDYFGVFSNGIFFPFERADLVFAGKGRDDA